MKPTPKFDHELHELVGMRWSPRAFAPQPVEHEKLMCLFEAARWAASAYNEQPWRFIYAASDEAVLYGKLFDCLARSNQAWAVSAPVLIMALVSTCFSHNRKQNRWAFHDLGLAIGNMTVQATAIGLCIHSMAGFSIERARVAFHLTQDVEPVTMIAAGYIGDPGLLPPDYRERELAVQERKPFTSMFIGRDSP